MSNYPFIVLPEPIQLDLNQVKENKMSTNETPTKPLVSLGDIDIEIDVNKPSDKFIITKKYKGYKLFYKMHRRACTDRLYKGTHFNTLAEAKAHFESFIKTNWKHTKQFQIEPVSNFFISNWRLISDSGGYYNSHDLTNKRKVILQNVPISIDEFKRGKPLTTVKELLEKFVQDAEKRKVEDMRFIGQCQTSISMTQQNLEQRAKRIDSLTKSETVIQQLIEQNTSKEEETVKLFYGKE